MKGLVLCPFSFAPNAAADPVVSSIIGPCIQSITYAATGTYVIKLKEKYAVFIGALDGLQLNAYADTQLQWSGFTAATASAPAQITLRIETAGIAATIAANANNRITALLLFSYNEKYA